VVEEGPQMLLVLFEWPGARANFISKDYHLTAQR
jgi:hypothetical protein